MVILKLTSFEEVEPGGNVALIAHLRTNDILAVTSTESKENDTCEE